jgi:hypothetical protein
VWSFPLSFKLLLFLYCAHGGDSFDSSHGFVRSLLALGPSCRSLVFNNLLFFSILPPPAIFAASTQAQRQATKIDEQQNFVEQAKIA